MKSKHPNALPMIITHGWPGSIIEQLKVIGPLTDPTAYGGTAADAFDVVIPSLPGYGFSGKPTVNGWDPQHIARAWAVLMQRLGYTRYVAQGGDWGNAVTEQMALQQPPGLLAIHTNMPATIPAEIAPLIPGGPEPAGLNAEEKHAWDQLVDFYSHGLGYAQEMSGRPQTLYALADSPVGLAAWIIDHDIQSYNLIARVFDGASEGLTRDDIVDNITLYWLTNTAVSSARLYRESKLAFFAPKGVPAANRRQRLSGGNLPGAGKLDAQGLSAPGLLQTPRKGHAFRCLGAAAGSDGRSPRDLPVGALTRAKGMSEDRRGFIKAAALVLAGAASHSERWRLSDGADEWRLPAAKEDRGGGT